MALMNRLRPGQRVELAGDPIGLILTKRTGRIVREDHWEGYYIVRLDGPAIYRDAALDRKPLFEIREAEDNLHALLEQQ